MINALMKSKIKFNIYINLKIWWFNLILFDKKFKCKWHLLHKSMSLALKNQSQNINLVWEGGGGGGA